MVRKTKSTRKVRKGVRKTRKVKVKGNPWALCKWLAKKHHWKKAKYERCVLSTKKAMHLRGRRKKT